MSRILCCTRALAAQMIHPTHAWDDARLPRLFEITKSRISKAMSMPLLYDPNASQGGSGTGSAGVLATVAAKLGLGANTADENKLQDKEMGQKSDIVQ